MAPAGAAQQQVAVTVERGGLLCLQGRDLGRQRMLAHDVAYNLNVLFAVVPAPKAIRAKQEPQPTTVRARKIFEGYRTTGVFVRRAKAMRRRNFAARIALETWIRKFRKISLVEPAAPLQQTQRR